MTAPEPAAVRVLVTGATGLIGSALVPLLLQAGFRVRANARRAPQATWATHPRCEFIPLDLDADLTSLVQGIDAVVHLAARVHVMRDTAPDPWAENRRINTQATLRLAQSAAAAGCRHFIFMSTIKVNGETTTEHPFTESDPARPGDAYATSKHEAEQGLRSLARSRDMGVTILRTPLVYGPGVKGNFASLVRAVRKGLPLPVGAVDNRRSLVYAGNLASAVLAVLAEPASGARTYLVSDGEDISTPGLVRAIAAAMGCRARLVSAPPALLRLAGRLTGRSEAVDRLLGSLRVDSSCIRRELHWTPTHSLSEGLSASLADAARR